MSRIVSLITLFIFFFCGGATAQHAVDSSSRYYRLICLVHLTGSGQSDNGAIMPEFVKEGVGIARAAAEASAMRALTHDPVREAAETAARNGTNTSSKAKFGEPPPGTPKPDAFQAARPGILAWAMQPADDRNMAIVYIVAADHHAFDAILNDKRPELRHFEIGRDSEEDIDKELRKFKKDFDLTTFRVMVP